MDSIKKIARRIVAGGGAGIDFRIQSFGDNHQITYRLNPSGDGFSIEEIEGSIDVDTFSAEGYYDGDMDVSAKEMFSEFSLNENEVKECIGEIFDFYKDKDWFIDALNEGNVCAYVYAKDGASGSSVFSAGWTRSILKAGSEVEFVNEFEVGLFNSEEDSRIDSMYSDMVIYGKLSEDGEEWYYYTFINPPEDEEETEDE